MQSIEQYGFTLLLSGKGKYANSDYLHIKNNIEKICHNAEYNAKKFQVDEAYVAVRMKDSIFATVYTDETKASFGIYYSQLEKLVQRASLDTCLLLTEKMVETFAIRSENIFRNISNGKNINMGLLKSAWVKQLNADKEESSEANFEWNGIRL